MVEFKPGHQNAAADALSRCDEEQVSVHVPSLPTFDIVDQFSQESMTLQEIITMKAQIEAGTAGKAWAVVDGIVVHDEHIFMPASSKLWPTVLEHAHGMGHEGIQKTLTRLRSSFTPGDNKLVRDFVRGCSVSATKQSICIRRASSSLSSCRTRCGQTSRCISLRASPRSTVSR
jgi:hypothetical protein